MREGLILEVKSLGVLVQVKNKASESGFDLCWSTDPSVPEDAPAHVLIGEKQMMGFLQAGAVPPEFINTNQLKFVRVSVGDDQISLNKTACIEAGMSSDAWSVVKTHVGLFGKNSNGPVSHGFVWSGSREDHDNYLPYQKGLEVAKQLGITPAYIVVKDSVAPFLDLAESIQEHRRDYSPARRASHDLIDRIKATLIELDVESLNPERARSHLIEIKAAFVAHERILTTAKILDMEASPNTKIAVAAESMHSASHKNSSGPKMH